MNNLTFLLFAIFIATTAAQSFRRGSGRITNGDGAILGQFPYQVGLISMSTSGSFYKCGGSLISKQWILTAAHCLEDKLKSTIYLGTIDRFSNTNLRVEKSNYVIHKDYNTRNLKNDIALVKLPEPIEFSNEIKPIDLDNDPSLNKWVNKDAIVSGWGNTATESKDTRFLRYAKVPIMSNEECASHWNSILPTQICQRVIENKGICDGDSGGPLAVTENGKRVLVGVTSFGRISCEIDTPRVFTRVAAYRQWICDNTENSVC